MIMRRDSGNEERHLENYILSSEHCIFNPIVCDYCSVDNSDTMSDITSVEFEVFGKVQGVFFRKYTQSKANELGLKGWCQNTPTGTVIGVIEGPPAAVAEMKHWLETTGSPSSRIDRVDFKDLSTTLSYYSYSDFSIRK
ncbi:hypothetical protein M8J75_016075 [Diaphorina citri]|nr:hypothetical protein M8J75_016075 [Diaphorina citri]